MTANPSHWQKPMRPKSCLWNVQPRAARCIEKGCPQPGFLHSCVKGIGVDSRSFILFLMKRDTWLRGLQSRSDGHDALAEAREVRDQPEVAAIFRYDS
jgi:hypothetical protein